MDAKTKKNAVNAGQTNNLMKEVSKVMTQADEAMKELTFVEASSRVTKATGIMDEIALASTDQTRDIGDVSKAVEEIDQLLQQSDTKALIGV